MTSSLEKILDKLEALRLMDKDSSMFQEVNLWRFFNRFKELDSYAGSILAIKDALKDEELKSEGL